MYRVRSGVSSKARVEWRRSNGQLLSRVRVFHITMIEVQHEQRRKLALRNGGDEHQRWWMGGGSATMEEKEKLK